MKSKPFVSVDCDTLVFSAAAVAETKSIEVTHKPTGVVKTFKNRTEFKDLMKSKGKVVTDRYVVVDVQEPHNVSHALKTIKSGVEQILDNYSDCEVVLCATAKDNFRDNIPYPRKYKWNRSSVLRPLLLKEAQSYIINKYKAIPAKGCEVDDLTAILAYDAVKQGRKAFLLSPDGDARQFDGLSLGDYQSKQQDCVDIQFWHDVEWNEQGFQSYGFPWMVMQHLVGDSSDGLKPTLLCGKKYGEKGCYNDLVKIKSPEDLVKFTIQKYKEWYPDNFDYQDWRGDNFKADWKFMLEIYWMGTTMMRNVGELPNYWRFLESKGVKYDKGW